MVNFNMTYGFYEVSLNLQHKQTNLFIWNFGIGSQSLKILVALRVQWQTHNVLLEFDANFATKLKERVIQHTREFQEKKNGGVLRIQGVGISHQKVFQFSLIEQVL